MLFTNRKHMFYDTPALLAFQGVPETNLLYIPVDHGMMSVSTLILISALQYVEMLLSPASLSFDSVVVNHRYGRRIKYFMFQ